MNRLLPPRTRLWAALSGALLAAACPPLNLFPIAWVGLIPLFFALRDTRGSGFGEGAAAGVMFNTGILYWLAFNSGTYLPVAFLTMVAAVTILSAAWGFAAWLFKRVEARLGDAAWALIPFSWTAFEGWLSHLHEIAFPWPLLALTQAGFSPALQIMEFTGVWGVSFWVAAANVVIFRLWMERRPLLRNPRLVGVVLLALVPLVAWLHALKWDRTNAPKLRVAVAQGSIPAEQKWAAGPELSWAAYDSLTKAVAAQDTPTLVVWPETALPADLAHQSFYAERLARLADETGSYILTGASDYARIEGRRRPLNAVFLTAPGRGLVDRGSKRDLVPFGERVPFQWLIPQLGELNLGQAEFLPGLRQTIFKIQLGERRLQSVETPPLNPPRIPGGSDWNTVESRPPGEASFPAMVCYESVFPWQARDAVRAGAGLLVTVSNDAWYGYSSEPAQIDALSRFRCIETRRSMVRASNSGVSSLADPLGRVVARTRLFESATLVADLPIMDGQTFYVRHGNLFLALVTAFFGVGLWMAARSRSERRGTSK